MLMADVEKKTIVGEDPGGRSYVAEFSFPLDSVKAVISGNAI